MRGESEPRTNRSAAFILAATVAAAFALRVIPAYPLVFAHGTVNFQEGDAWFHMRTVHNLLAHFPLRSGFDPYALFPRGQNIPTGPIWDYLLATVAWLLGLGSPSATLIDRVGAWMPAIIGAAFPIPAYVLARRQFGSTAAAFTALWMALASGGFLWLTHLGLADHHAAEGLFAFLTLCFVATALDTEKMRFAWLAGIAMGLYLATRPAGIFIPAMLACLILLESKAAAIVLRAAAIAALIFLSAAGILWSNYTWLALSLTVGLAAATLALDALAQRRNWRSLARKAIPWLLLAAGLAISAVFVPSQWISLAGQIRRVAGSAPGSQVVATVQELQPVYRSGPVPGWTSVFGALGVIWIPALGGLALLLSRKPRGSARLLILWSVVVAVAAVMQVRMVVYLVPVAAVLAGAASAWLAGFGSQLQRRILAAAMVVAVASATLVFAVADVRNDRSPDADRRAAYAWLRSNTPEPEQDPGMWTRYYPQRAYQPGPHDLPFPSAQWGVAVPWDFGYEAEQIAQRIPMANGTQSGSNEMASFYTDTLPEEAVAQLRQSGARYVLIDPQAPLFVGFNQSRFLSQLETLQRSPSDYVQVFLRQVPDGFKATPVYLQAYYQSMAARLFVGDGLAETGTGPWVFEIGKVASGDGRTAEVIDSSHRFATDLEAADYIAKRRDRKTIIGCIDPGVSCFDIPAVSGLRLVFTSDPLPVSKGRTVHAVKIFEVLPFGVANPTP